MATDNSNQWTRRQALKGVGAVGAALAAPIIIPAVALGKDGATAPSERIGLGLIGCGGMGQVNLKACASQDDVAIVGICDVWKRRLDGVFASHKDTAKPYHDYREMLQQKDIDGVIIATPPHWHCRMAIDACEAGKDIFLQKPMTLHLGESLAVRNAVNKHQRICQVGTQIHAEENYRRVVELVRSGNLGKVSMVRTFCIKNQGPNGIGHNPNTNVPNGFDWNMWIGPYPMRPYNAHLAGSAYEHCSFMVYSGGWTPGMAPHFLDLPVWALDLGYPTATYCSGGRYIIKDDGDAPDTQEVTWQYPNVTMTWWMSLVSSLGFNIGRGNLGQGVYFHGLNGTVFSNYGAHEVLPEGDSMKDAQTPPKSIPPSPGHEREWLDCMKSRQQPSCNPNYHCKIDVPIVLANLSMKLGRSIRFDPQAEAIVGDAEAAKAAVPEYRAPWKFPTEYLGAPA